MGLACCCMKGTFSQQNDGMCNVKPKMPLAKIRSQESERQLDPNFVDTTDQNGFRLRGPPSIIVERCKKSSSDISEFKGSSHLRSQNKASVDSETVQHKLVRDILYPDVNLVTELDKHQVSEQQAEDVPELAGSLLADQEIETAGRDQESACRLIHVRSKVKHDVSVDCLDAVQKEIPAPLFEESAKIGLDHLPRADLSRTPVSLNQVRNYQSNLSKPKNSETPKQPNINFPELQQSFSRYSPSIISMKDEDMNSAASPVAHSINWLSAKSDKLFERFLPCSPDELGLKVKMSPSPRAAPAAEIKPQPELLRVAPVQLVHRDLPKDRKRSDSQVTECRLNLMRIVEPSKLRKSFAIRV